MNTLTIIIFTAASIQPLGHCSLCYECTSLDVTWCSEHMNEEERTLHFDNVVNCSGKLCMKLIGHSKGQRDFYVRTCDMTLGFPDTCVTGSHVLGIPTSTVCVCNGDRCNTGHMTSRMAGIFTVIYVTLTLTYVSYKFDLYM